MKHLFEQVMKNVGYAPAAYLPQQKIKKKEYKKTFDHKSKEYVVEVEENYIDNTSLVDIVCRMFYELWFSPDAITATKSFNRGFEKIKEVIMFDNPYYQRYADNKDQEGLYDQLDKFGKYVFGIDIFDAYTAIRKASKVNKSQSLFQSIKNFDKKIDKNTNQVTEKTNVPTIGNSIWFQADELEKLYDASNQFKDLDISMLTILATAMGLLKFEDGEAIDIKDNFIIKYNNVATHEQLEFEPFHNNIADALLNVCQCNCYDIINEFNLNKEYGKEEKDTEYLDWRDNSINPEVWERNGKDILNPDYMEKIYVNNYHEISDYAKVSSLACLLFSFVNADTRLQIEHMFEGTTSFSNRELALVAASASENRNFKFLPANMLLAKELNRNKIPHTVDAVIDFCRSHAMDDTYADYMDEDYHPVYNTTNVMAELCDHIFNRYQKAQDICMQHKIVNEKLIDQGVKDSEIIYAMVSNKELLQEANNRRASLTGLAARPVASVLGNLEKFVDAKFRKDNDIDYDNEEANNNDEVLNF